MIKIYHRFFKGKELKELEEFRVGTWVDFYGEDENELSRISKMLNLEKDLLLDALDEHEVPRLDVDDGVIFVFARVPEKNNAEIVTAPLLIAIGKDFILTASKHKCSFLDAFRDGSKDFFTTQKTKTFFTFFSAINDSYAKNILETNKKIRSMKVRLEKIKPSDIIQFVDIERIFNEFLSALIPMNAVFEKILHGKYMEMYEDDKDLAEDVFLTSGQLIANTKSSHKNVVNIRDAYSNIMTHDLNRVMKILTSLTIILTIPTMIFSFYGMNVNLPFSNSHVSSIGIIVFTLFLSSLLLLIFRRNRWL